MALDFYRIIAYKIDNIMSHYFKFRSCEEKNFKSLEENQIYASEIDFFITLLKWSVGRM